MAHENVWTPENDLLPAEAFKIVGNETRLAILAELSENTDQMMSFSELRKRVGMRDGSQFNYHLEKLQDGFIGKREDGYYITHAGSNVVSAVVSGTFTDHPTIEPFGIDGTCAVCGSGLVGRYENKKVFVECPACDQLHVMGGFPPGGLAGRTGEEVLLAQDKVLRASYLLALADICKACGGRTARTLLRGDDTLPEEAKSVILDDAIDFRHGPGAIYQCDECEYWCYMTAGEHVLFDPIVGGFHRDHGVDLHRTPLWRLEWTLPVVSSKYTRTISDEPLRFELSIPLEEEVLVLTLDDAFEIVDHRCESAAKSRDAE